MTEELRITQAERTYTAVIRSRVRPDELKRFIPHACGEVWSFIRSANLPRPGRHLALYLDAQGSIEVGAEVSEPFAGNDRIHCSELPAGRAATAIHFGPYSRLGDTHSSIHAWCAERGYQCSGICWEIYGHWEEAWNSDPSSIRTDVFYLLEGAPIPAA